MSETASPGEQSHFEDPRFLEFYAATYNHSIYTASTALRSRDDAEALVDAVYLRMVENWEKIGNPYTWLTAVLARTIAGQARSRDRWREKIHLLRTEAWHRSIVDPVKLAELREDHHRVRDAIQRLPLRQRTAAVLAWILELDTVDVAAHMNCNEATVRVHLGRARAKLHKQFAGGRALNQYHTDTERGAA